ncbi:hypothetical protein ACE2AJ_18695 [Aquihabitans daechungensis]|uniref:hypothetical protein n=1 Tax=Aquihabitans daechungensis TaxID=1052257 RepID=UPI003BA04FA0
MAADDVRPVFVYGTLLSEPSLLRTLVHRSEAPTATPFVLDGWERAWNVVSARTFALADDPSGAIHRRLVLGLQARAGARCQGVALEATADDLAALAAREAAYELVEIAPGRTPPVWTYLPLPHRTLESSAVSEPLVVEQAYLDACRAGIRHHGLPDAAAELDRSLAGLRIATAAR